MKQREELIHSELFLTFKHFPYLAILVHLYPLRDALKIPKIRTKLKIIFDYLFI